MPDGTLQIDNATIMFRNFAGREGEYNAAGDRNFAVALDPDLADQMDRDGWNVRQLKPRNGEPGQHYLPVSIKYVGRNGVKLRPPEVWVQTSKGKRKITEETIENLDYFDIERVDLIINPFTYNVSGRSGIKAYVKSLYFIVAEDALALRYRDVREIGEADEPLAIESGEVDFIDGEAYWDDEAPKAIER